ncbi:MAG: twin-arginine translocase TatA/TatE family subunit [Deferribacterales bacterium]|jgi:sec-independent protein translocase protein TatA/sec-independent protein translocase protein TatB|uniref:twin-arginine translocase TatA/TatE family subunit n=1 Tax=Deferrivibrio essentukiensis TaxID=2880922 RepID=UPI001993C946|nr:twin-arginine translocase TatA/TatE family subunit [Deferrivibrio essentukiensis]MBC7197116.1 twin-arginine translocase TatA/TatE family subunit [Deferribacterales bacterium]
MFGLGMSEIILILALALIVIGPNKLPEVAKALGKGYAEFKKVLNDFKDAVNIEDDTPPKNTYSSKTRDDLKEIHTEKFDKKDESITKEDKREDA